MTVKYTPEACRWLADNYGGGDVHDTAKKAAPQTDRVLLDTIDMVSEKQQVKGIFYVFFGPPCQEFSMKHNLIDMTGKKCGKLTVIRRYGNSKRAQWLCICECGREAIARGTELRSGKKTSCGKCVKHEPYNKIHGDQGSRLYSVWLGMKTRCYNENVHNYHNYGGRGIRVCDEWLHDYPMFKEWAIENGYDWNAPRGKCTIDRIDPDGNYEPSNCRWADMKTQRRNQRRCRKAAIEDGGGR